MDDRLLSLHIEGFRSIKDLTVNLEGLQVLIGENGSGKSTILEAFEILKKTCTQPNFTHDLSARHGPFHELRRIGADSIRLTARATVSGLDVEYSILLMGTTNSPISTIADERLTVEGVLLLSRNNLRVEHRDVDSGKMKPVGIGTEVTALNALWGIEAPPEVNRFRELLRAIRVHLSFETRPRWAFANEREVPVGMRTLSQLAPATRLEAGGANLASAFQKLNRDADKWKEVLVDLRMGLGQDLVNAAIDVKQTGGFGELVLYFKGLGSVPASQLSDGQLSFLGFVALLHLDENDSVVLIDEPELHLHPAMLGTLAGLFVRLASKYPVIVATHADAILDEVPEECVRVVRLDDLRASQVARLDHARLEKWRAEFQTLGTIRREGVLSEVVEAGP